MATLTTSYQLIANKLIGTVSGSGVSAKNIYLRIYARYNSQSIVDNKSNVSYKSTLYVDGSGTYFYTGSTTTKTLSGTGATSVSADAQGNYNVGETTLSEITGTVTHGSNGAASVSITAGWVSAPWGISGSVTGTATLPTIARATTPVLAATTITMGASINITLTPANSTFKHKLRYDFGNVKGSATGFSMGAEFTAQGTRTVTFTPPTSLGSQIPNNTSGTGQIVCYTYTSTGAHIGTTYVKITLNIPSYNPTITGITLTGNKLLSSTYVQGKSTATVNATVATSYGATIKSITSVIDGKTYSGLPFTTGVLSSGSKTAKITIVDTRNKGVTVESAAIQVYAYATPNITEFTLARQTDGTTVIATVKGSIAAINNKNAKTIKVTLNGVTNTIASSSYTISATTTFTGISTDSTFTAKAVFTDSYVSIERNATLPTVAVTMDFYKDGNGIAMGKVAESGNLFDVAWNERVRGTLQVDGAVTLAKGLSTPLSIANGGTGVATSSALARTHIHNDIAGSASSGGTLGYLRIVRVQIVAAYVNQPIEIKLCRRLDSRTTTISLLFNNSSNLDPGYATFIADGPAPMWLYKAAASTWDIYVQKAESYDYVGILDAKYTDNLLEKLTVTFTDVFASSVPSGAIAATKIYDDYVVDEGVSGIWTYRKWNNGVAECWGTLTGTLSPYTTINGFSGYEGSVSFPTGLFTATPNVQFQPYIGNGFAIPARGVISTNTQCKWVALSNVSAANTTVKVDAFAIGKWK